MKARILLKNRFRYDAPDRFDYALAAIVATLVGLATAPASAITRLEGAIVVTLVESPSQPEREVSPAAQIGIPSESTGERVTDVTPGTPAEAGALRRGDVIEEVDGKPTATMDQFHAPYSRLEMNRCYFGLTEAVSTCIRSYSAPVRHLERTARPPGPPRKSIIVAFEKRLKIHLLLRQPRPALRLGEPAQQIAEVQQSSPGFRRRRFSWLRRLLISEMGFDLSNRPACRAVARSPLKKGLRVNFHEAALSFPT
jgi:hypothetical protein